MPADDDTSAIDPAGHAVPCQFANVGRQDKIYTAFLSGQYKRLCHRVFGHLVKGSSEPQYLVFTETRLKVDRGDLRTAIGQRSGLVQHQRNDASHILQWTSTLHQHTEMSGT